MGRLVNVFSRLVFTREMRNERRDKSQFLIRKGCNSLEWVRKNKVIADRKNIRIDVSIRELSEEEKTSFAKHIWNIKYLDEVDFEKVSKLNRVLGNWRAVHSKENILDCQGQYWLYLILYEGSEMYYVAGVEKINQDD